MAATPCTASRCWWDECGVLRGSQWPDCYGSRRPSRKPPSRRATKARRSFAAGAGRDETFYACTACHGFKLVAQQGMTRAQWDDSINLMVRRHNMPPLDDKDRDVVLNYLEAAYPPRAPTGRGGWQNPFAK